MKLSMKTVVLQEMVNRSIKGASNNKLIPLTSLMCIELKGKTLSLTTTNASDYLYIRNDKVEGEEFYAVVQTEQFSKLIARMTSENTSLEVDNGILTITGNGTYKIELPMDEEGESIKYPNPVIDVDITQGEHAEINLSTVKSILNTNSAALAVTMEMPEYTGYFIGDKVVSTDTFKVCALDSKLFEQEVLMSPETMNLLGLMTEEKIQADIVGDVFVFTTPDCVVYGHKMEGIEDYNIDAIEGLLDMKIPATCKISKNDLLATLDRIALFVGTYDNKAITLNFTKKGLAISSKQSNGTEVIPYMDSKNVKDFICAVDIIMLIQQIKANQADAIQIEFGDDSFLRFVDGNITQIIALLQE